MRPSSGSRIGRPSPAVAALLARASERIDLSGGAAPDFAYYTALPKIPFLAFAHVTPADPTAGQPAIARLLQDRSREFAVAETLDGGKPIKESRDFDLPMAAAHFFYHAGWADKLDYVAPGRTLARSASSAR